MKANFKIKEEDKGNVENEDKKSTEMTEEEFAKKGENVWTYRSKSRQR
jgi:hypothetical protein|tara:strand:- start:90 stop:233 length:144 start_codon:yes stop_codon:yes gene_type:complete